MKGSVASSAIPQLIHPELLGRTCYHRYEIVPGYFTPGQFLSFDPKRCLDELGVAADLSGLRALDIGAWDGPLSFELERRGAEVTALDIQDPDVTIFNAAKKILGSSARFVRCGVYDATPDLLGRFDIVVFAGVYYHLKNPVLSFQRIRRLLTDTGRLFIEGGACTDYLAGELAATLKVSKARVSAALDRLPISYFDIEQKIYGDWSNWFFPSTRCLEAMLLDSGFRDVQLRLRHNAFYDYSHRRLMGRADPDPSNPDPAAQQREHAIATEDLRSESRAPAAGRLRFLPAWLREYLRSVRRRMRQRG